jgi:hypothetical protein
VIVSDSWTVHRARAAGKRRQNPDADIDDELRDMRAARAEDYIRDLVDTFPPLTQEQRSRLAAILRTSRTVELPDGDAA